MRESLYHYKDGDRWIPFVLVTKKDSDKWNRFCNKLRITRPEDPNPNRSDWDTFLEKIDEADQG